MHLEAPASVLKHHYTISAEEHSHKAPNNTTARLSAARRLNIKDTRRECSWHASDNLPATPHASFLFNLLLSLSSTLPVFHNLSHPVSISFSYPLSLSPPADGLFAFFVSLSPLIISSIFTVCQAKSAQTVTHVHANVFPVVLTGVWESVPGAARQTWRAGE